MHPRCQLNLSFVYIFTVKRTHQYPTTHRTSKQSSEPDISDLLFYNSKNIISKMHPVVKTIWDFGIAIGPVIGYVYQYFLIRKRKSIGTFSINLCGVLLFCNILRLGFYFFVHYDKALVAQSILMIAAQILLLQICVKTMNEQGIFNRMREQHNGQEGFCTFFWKWKQYYKYLMVTAVYFFFVIVLSVWFSNLGYTGIGEVIGFVSLISESLIMLPQVVENYKQGRVKGLSHLLVFLNNIGDIMKLAYFFLNDQPRQFIICGFVQVSLDITVIVQIVYYGCKNKDQPETTDSDQGQKDPNYIQKKSEPETDEKMQVVIDNIVQKPPGEYNELQEEPGNL